MTERTVELLWAQWGELRAWLDEYDVLSHGDRPTGLGTWTVSDIVVHLGLGLGMLTEIRAAEPGARTLSLGRYVAAYPPAASSIAAKTRELADNLGTDVLGGLDTIAAEARAAEALLTAPAVLGRRGPITLRDYLLTRLLELVVHADDLDRVLTEVDRSPVVPEAALLVADALAEAYEERAGRRPDTGDTMAWIRVAAGRTPTDDPSLPLL